MVTSVLEREKVREKSKLDLSLPILEKIPITPKDGDTIPVNEIFLGYQGEGGSVGTQQVFLRLAGCNFWEDGHNCPYCDTAYSGLKSQGTLMTIDKIVRTILEYPCKNIFLTGGEVLSHKGIFILVQELHYADLNIELQTNGSYLVWPSNIVKWSVDIKTPSSHNLAYNRYENLEILQSKDQVKFIVSNRDDFEFAKNRLSQYPTKATVYLQPAWNTLDPKELLEWMKNEMSYKVRLSMQQQKWIYGANTRGV